MKTTPGSGGLASTRSRRSNAGTRNRTPGSEQALDRSDSTPSRRRRSQRYSHAEIEMLSEPDFNELNMPSDALDSSKLNDDELEPFDEMEQHQDSLDAIYNTMDQASKDTLLPSSSPPHGFPFERNGHYPAQDENDASLDNEDDISSVSSKSEATESTHLMAERLDSEMEVVQEMEIDEAEMSQDVSDVEEANGLVEEGDDQLTKNESEIDPSDVPSDTEQPDSLDNATDQSSNPSPNSSFNEDNQHPTRSSSTSKIKDKQVASRSPSLERLGSSSPLSQLSNDDESSHIQPVPDSPSRAASHQTRRRAAVAAAAAISKNDEGQNEGDKDVPEDDFDLMEDLEENAADNVEDGDDPETRATKEYIQRAKLEAKELKNCVENVMNRFFDIKLQEIDLEIELVRSGTHPELARKLQELELKKDNTLQRAADQLKHAVSSSKAVYEATIKISMDNLTHQKRQYRASNLEKLYRSEWKLKSEYQAMTSRASDVPQDSPSNIANKRKLALEYAASSSSGLSESVGDVPSWVRRIVKKRRKAGLDPILVPPFCDGLNESEKDDDIMFLRLLQKYS